jgi:hypothetical protein
MMKLLMHLFYFCMLFGLYRKFRRGLTIVFGTGNVGNAEVDVGAYTSHFALVSTN